MRPKYLFILSLPMLAIMFFSTIYNGINIEFNGSENHIFIIWASMFMLPYFFLYVYIIKDIFTYNKKHILLILFIPLYLYIYYFIIYKTDNEKLKDNTKVVKKVKYAFFISLIIPTISLLEIFKILDVNKEPSNSFIIVLLVSLVLPTFYLWYYMLVDVYEKNKIHFSFMLILFPYIWIYYLFFYKKSNENIEDRLS